MNITTRSMSKRTGKKFVALDSEDEDPDYELDTNAEVTDEEEELLSDISEDEDSEEFNGTGESGESFIVEDTDDSDYDFEEEIALKYLDTKNKCIKIESVKKASHNEGWSNFWANNYNKIPSCIN